METRQFSPKIFLANYNHSNYYAAVEELNVSFIDKLFGSYRI